VDDAEPPLPDEVAAAWLDEPDDAEAASVALVTLKFSG